MRNAARPIVTLATAGIVIATGIGAAGATAAKPSVNKITGGTIKVAFSASSVAALKSGHLKITPISPSTYTKNTLTSHVMGGSLNFLNQTADVKSTGGLKISEGSKSISISKLESKSSSSGGTGTATVSGHGRIAAITTSPATPSLSGNTVTASNLTVTLTKPLVKILDKEFGTTLFKSHAKLGTATVMFTYK